MFFESPLLNFITLIALWVVATKLLLMLVNKLTGKNYKLIKDRPRPEKHCKNCGFEGKPKSRPGGSTFWTVFWIIVFVPIGLLYWISRYGNPIHFCPKCKSENLIDTDAPILNKGA